jgi:6-phosphogluconolactonase (cycloisomerase 2 family)
VTSANDSGLGTLRWAITTANSSPGADEISFNLPANQRVIQLNSKLDPLSDLSGGTTIDGDMDGDKRPDIVLRGKNTFDLIPSGRRRCGGAPGRVGRRAVGRSRGRRAFARLLGFEEFESRIVLSATISGTVWNDGNGNGVRDYAEPGVAGVRLFVDLNDNGQFETDEPSTLSMADDPATQADDESGRYVLASDHVAGQRSVRQVLPAGTVQSFPSTTTPLRFVEALIDGQVDASGNGVDRLANPLSAAVSPDGLYVYVAAYGDDAVTVFRRDLATGRLTVVESLTDGQPDSGGTIVANLAGAWHVAVSPDGMHVYAAAPDANAVVVFQRDVASGVLRFVESVRDGGLDAQGHTVDGLRQAWHVTVSPNGSHVYASGFGDDAVAVFARSSSSGRLTFVQVLKDGGLDAQGAVIDGLNGSVTVTVSPDGGHVYASGYHDDAVVTFQRDAATGRLAVVETLKDGGADGAGATVDGLNGSRSVTVSADGKSVYVAASVEDYLSVFRRDSVSGRLSFVQVMHGELAWGLADVRGLAISPDGAHVYAVAGTDSDLVVFDRDSTTSRLEYRQLLDDGTRDGRGAVVDGLSGAHGATVSPDGRYVYVASYDDHALGVFEVQSHPGGHPVWLATSDYVTGLDFAHRTPRANGVLYVRVDFPDKPGEPVSEGVARAAMAAVNDAYIFNSYDKQAFPDVVVTPTFRMPNDTAYYKANDPVSLRSAAKAAAVAAGYNVDSYSHVIYAFKRVYGWNGLARMPGKWVMLSDTFDSSTTAHELKHNLGVGHSFRWDTTDGSIIGPGVKVLGQPFDGNWRFMAYWKAKTGWIDRSAQVVNATSSGTYTIHGLDLVVNDPADDYALTVTKDANLVYWIEFRPGLVDNPYVTNGVAISWEDILLDMTPNSASGDADALDSPLLIGRTFSDTTAGIHITPVAKDDAFPGSVDVVVNLGQFSNNRSPNASFYATRSQVFVGETVSFADMSSDPDLDALANFWTFGDGTWQTNRQQAAKSWSAAGTYEVQLEVTDMRGGTATAKQTITVSVPSGPYLRITPHADAVAENGAVTATLTRQNTSLSSALTVLLTSSDGTELRVPATVTIPAGQTSVDFTLNGVDDGLLDGTQVVTIEATAGGFLPDSLSFPVTDYETLTVTINAGAISEHGGSATGTVSRSNTDQSAALTVNLASSDVTEAAVPASVTIPANQASATVTIAAVDDAWLDGTQTVTVTASAAGYVSGTKTVDVTDYETLTVTIDATSMSENGASATGTVTRSNTDTGQALAVTLASSDTTEAVVPTSVTIPANEASATFTIAAVDDTLLDGTQTVTVTASAAGYVSGTKIVDVTDYETLTVTIDVASMSENGGIATGTVTRSNTDTGQALNVSLASSDTTEAAVPASVTIPTSQASATFTIAAVDDTLLDGTQTVTVTASAAGYVSGTKTLSVTDYETLTVTINVASMSENGGSATGTVTRSNTDARRALSMILASSDTTEAAVPASVTIPANEASATFTIAAVDDTLLDGTQTVTVSVSAAGYLSGTKTLDVTDFETLTVTIDATSMSENGGSATGTVTRSNTDTGQALTVTLASSDTTEAAVPASVTIPANEASATFTIAAVDDTLLDGTQTLTVTAAAAGYIIGDATLDVTDFDHVPTISDIADQTSEEDTPKGPVAFAVGDVETAPGSLAVTARSDNQTLLPDANLVLGGSGANRTLTLTPAAHQLGVATITVSVSDGAASASDTFVLTVTAVNDPPARLAGTLTPIRVAEDSANTTDVTLGLDGVTYGPGGGADEGGQTLTYKVTAIPSFITVWNGGALVATDTTVSVTELRGLTYKTVAEANGTGSLSWTVTDNGAPAQTIMENLAITIAAVNDAPVFTSSSTPSVPENTTAAVSLAASDADLPAQTIGFSITGGADQAKFQIVSGNQLRFKAAPDYEAPTDAGANNVYEVSVAADDGAGGTTVRIVSVTVTPVNDNSPVFTSSGAPSVAENTAAVVTLTATDADLPAQTVGFSITGGADQSKFEIVAGELRFKVAPDYELPADVGADNIYEVSITADDGAGRRTVQSLSVTVTPVNDNSPVPVADAIAVVEGGTATVLVGGATSVLANDMDADLPNDALRVNTTPLVAPQHGTLTLNVDGTFSYMHDGSEQFTDSFTYEVRDAANHAAQAVLTITVLGPTWQNPRHPCDVSDDGSITPLDVLLLINDINAHGSRQLPASPTPTPPPFLDPNGDDAIAPRDVLLVINYINAHGSGPIPAASGGEGEHAAELGVQEISWLPGTDTAKSRLSMGTADSWQETTAGIGGTGQLASTLPWARPATVTTPMQRRLLESSQDDVSPHSHPSPRSTRATRLLEGSAEFPSETRELDEAIAAIAAEIRNAWGASF